MQKTQDKMTEEIANLKTARALTAAQTATEAERPQLIRETSRGTAAESDISTANISAASLRKLLAQKGIDIYSTSAGDVAAKSGMIGSDISKAISPVSDIVSTAMGARNAYFKGRLLQDEYRFPSGTYGGN
jgi:copper homeostasis protein CutC